MPLFLSILLCAPTLAYELLLMRRVRWLAPDVDVLRGPEWRSVRQTGHSDARRARRYP